MKIDYAKIIEAANRRKDLLQKLEGMLGHAPEMLQKLEEVSLWLHELEITHSALDSEGRQLVPVNLTKARQAVHNCSVGSWDYLGRGVNGNVPHLRSFRIALGIGEEPSE